MHGQYAWAQLHGYAATWTRRSSGLAGRKQIAEASVPGAVAMMEETLGLAYLHKADMDNGAFRKPGDSACFRRAAAGRVPGQPPARRRRRSIS